jgi:hypothetical protein
MKNFIITALLLCCFGAAVVSPAKPVKKASKPAINRAGAVKTDRYYICNDQLCPIYRLPNGKLIAVRISRKTGNQFWFGIKPGTDTHDWEGN